MGCNKMLSTLGMVQNKSQWQGVFCPSSRNELNALCRYFMHNLHFHLNLEKTLSKYQTHYERQTQYCHQIIKYKGKGKGAGFKS